MAADTCRVMWKSPIRPSGNVYCDLPDGHDGSHEGGRGEYRYIWNEDGHGPLVEKDFAEMVYAQFRPRSDPPRRLWDPA